MIKNIIKIFIAILEQHHEFERWHVRQWNKRRQMKIEINEVGYQTLAMSLDGKPVCEFIFDGDEVQITDQNGAPLLDEDKAVEYLRILMESANIELVDADESGENDHQVQFKIG